MKANTTAVISSPLGRDALKLRKFVMNDGLSRPFQIELEVVSEDFDLDFDKLLGAGMGVELTRPGNGKRHFHGLVSHISLAGHTARQAIYQISLRPWLWFLKHTSDCRIFQDKSVPEIVRQEVCKKKNFSDVENMLSGRYAKREYCVQYCESDFAFVSRLMEEEGIYYYFKHEQNKHTLVLCDSAKAHAAAQGYEKIAYRPQDKPANYHYEVLTEWRETREVVPGAHALASFDFEKPRQKLTGNSAAPAAHAQGALEVFDFPGGFKETDKGEALAQIRREQVQLPARRYLGAGNPQGVGVGNTFRLSAHRRDKLNREYLVVAAQTWLESNESEFGATKDAASYRYRSTLECIASDHRFGPPRVTPKARIRGPQTAIVVGPKSDEIHTDKYGRIKLKFHWDRHGSSDEKASCWVRVSQAAAGKGWGQVFIPRVGQEVVVGFIDGDPDCPLVTGQVYNADQMPPYELPKHQSRSTIKTHSTPGGSDANFNELRFEDKKGEEEIYLHAERDFNRVVENNDALKVGFEKKEQGNQTVDIYNNQTITVGASGCGEGSQTLTVWQDRKTTLRNGDDRLTLNKGDQSIKLDAGAQTVEAAKSITLKVGQNSITIDQSGITLKGIQIKIEGQAGVTVEGLKVAVTAETALDLSGLCASVDGNAALKMSAPIVKIN